jgi:mono/diheme cytochrome c family protein
MRVTRGRRGHPGYRIGMKRPPSSVVTLSLLLALAGCAGTRTTTASAGVSRGEYLARIMDCAGCHTPGALTGKPDFSRNLAGSDVGFHVPGAGVFYPPNLTPDRTTGLGGWTDAQIARAIRHGERPDGRRLLPVMPWPSYSALTDADVTALVAHLRTLPPISRRVPPPTLEGQKPPGPYLDLVAPR